MNNVALSKLLNIGIILLAMVLAYVGAIKLFYLFMPFLIGLLVSKLITPVVNFLHHYLKLPNNLSTTMAIFTVIGLSGYTLYALAMLALFYLGELADILPAWGNSIVDFGTQLSDQYRNLALQLPFDPASWLSKGIANLFSTLGAWATDFAGKGLSVAISLPKLLIAVIVTILSAFFFTKDRKSIDALILPYKRKFITENEYYQSFKQDVLSVIWGYLKAQLILMSITTVICFIGLSIIGIPKALPIAFGIGLVDALPLLGPAAAYLPWIISTIVAGNTAVAFKLFILYLCTTITRQIIEPKVVGTQIGIHPMLTLAALYIGVKLLGAPGLIIGPFTGVTIMAMYKRYYKNDTKIKIDEL